ncbi:MAG: ATP-binding protein, partial [Caulobacteraceae bacterium]
VVLGCLVWVSGGPAAPVCAAAIWLSIIFFGQTYALESPSGLAVTGAVPAILMLAIVAVDPAPLAAQSGPAWALLALAVAFAGEGAARGMLTRRRLADAQGLIIDSEARYRVLADNVTDAIALTRMDGKRLYISPSFEQLLGKSTAEILAESVYQNVHPDDAERVAKYVESLGATGGRGVVECRLIHEDGTVNWVETSVSVTAPAKPGELGEVISVSRIINERKAMEARLVEALGMAEKAAAAKSDFLANMSHELRTPLNAIIGFAGLLEASSKLDSGDARHAHLIAEASASLLDTVNSILDFSKFEAGSVELESRPFDPLAEAEAVAAMLADQARAKGLSIEVRAEGETPLLQGDPARLRQVLLNFLANAVKFTSKGGIGVRVRQIAAGEGKRKLRLEVIDSGIGIPADHLDSIFERFAQADASVSRRFGGTGLGLAICRRIAELMNGEVGASSAPGKGSVFWLQVVLPIAEDTEAAAPETAEPPAPARVDRPLRILLTEDVAVNRELIAALLQPFDIVIDMAEDGTAAVAQLEVRDYDLVLMDMQMPVMDGVSATRRIRSMERRAAREVPIIAMTANVLPDQIERCLEAGMNDHIAKPVNPARLL